MNRSQNQQINSSLVELPDTEKTVDLLNLDQFAILTPEVKNETNDWETDWSQCFQNQFPNLEFEMPQKKAGRNAQVEFNDPIWGEVAEWVKLSDQRFEELERTISKLKMELKEEKKRRVELEKHMVEQEEKVSACFKKLHGETQKAVQKMHQNVMDLMGSMPFQSSPITKPQEDWLKQSADESPLSPVPSFNMSGAMEKSARPKRYRNMNCPKQMKQIGENGLLYGNLLVKIMDYPRKTKLVQFLIIWTQKS
jgi:hypothetical protein